MASIALSLGNSQSSGIPDTSQYPVVESTTVVTRRRRANESWQMESESKKQRGKSEKMNRSELEYEAVWICVECKEAECMLDPEATDLLICDGLCRRVFHYPCAGLSKLPREDEEFVCTDCSNGRHLCSFCSNYGKDGMDVFKCSKKSCGLFFHESCLAMQNVDVDIVSTSENLAGTMDDTTNKLAGLRVRFTCPAHSCWSCVQNELKESESVLRTATIKDQKKVAKGRKKALKPISTAFESKQENFLSRCLECPIAYHITCIPPPARFHELATLCHEHAGAFILPQLNPEDSVQDKIEKEIDKKFDQLVDRRRRRVGKSHGGTNSFFPGLSGTAATSMDSKLLDALEDDTNSNLSINRLWFCLPCDFKDEVHAKPPVYQHVQSLQFDAINKPPRIPTPSDECHCVLFCNDSCINRVLYTECYGDASKQGISNCSVGPDCGNRQLGQRKTAKCKPIREKGKGWGLSSIATVMKGDLVQEYVGDVIDAKEKEHRLIEWYQQHPNDSNFYIMELQSGWFIDARNVANLSRFINHSCEPNCSLQNVNVNGRMRCGIFALRNIDAGESLSYDYHFDTRHGDRFFCCCGSHICRGSMKGGPTRWGQFLNKEKGKSELFDDAKASFERDRKFLIEYAEDKLSRSTLVKASVPGAEGSNSNEDLVANGPHSKHEPFVRTNRVFLWRNVVEGSDFSSRFAGLSS